MRRVGKSLQRKKRKNIQIRKLTKRGSKLKKSTKSLTGEDNDAIHEKNEDEVEEAKVLSPEKRLPEHIPFDVPSPEKGSKRSKLSSIQKPVNQLIRMQKSIYEGRPMTVFFQYPDYCGVEKPEENVIHFTQEEFKKQGYALTFRINSSTHTYNSVVNSMKNAGFSLISR